MSVFCFIHKLYRLALLNESMKFTGLLLFGFYHVDKNSSSCCKGEIGYFENPRKQSENVRVC